MAHEEKWGPTCLQVILDMTETEDWVCSRALRLRSGYIKPSAETDIVIVREVQGDQPVLMAWATGQPITPIPLDAFLKTRPTIVLSECTVDDATGLIVSFIYSDQTVSALYQDIPEPEA